MGNPKKRNCEHTCADCVCRCHRQMQSFPFKEQALEKLFQELSFKVEVEEIPLSESLGRVTAANVYAEYAVPNADISLHDGIALQHSQAEKILEQEKNCLEEGTYYIVGMGDVIPAACDTIVPDELCQFTESGNVALRSLPAQGEGIIRQGSSIRPGEQMLTANRKLTPAHLGILRLAGVEHLSVYRKPRVTIVAVGQNCQPAGNPLLPGQAVEADSILISSVIQECGGISRVLPPVVGTETNIENVIVTESSQCDLLILIGGIGKRGARYGDHAVAAIQKIGRIILQGVQIAPGGTNLLFAEVNGTCIMGIPGPPHGALMITEQFLPPIMEQFLHCPCWERQEIEVVLGADFTSQGKTPYLARPALHWNGQDYEMTPLRPGDTVDGFINSAAVAVLSSQNTACHKGDRMRVQLIYSERAIRQYTAACPKEEGKHETADK